MKCENCGATLLKGGVFVEPPAAIAAGETKVRYLSSADLLLLAICTDCAAIRRADGERWILFEDAADQVLQARQDHADAVAAELVRRHEQARRDREMTAAQQRAAVWVASGHTLGAALLAAGLAPSARLAPRPSHRRSRAA